MSSCLSCDNSGCSLDTTEVGGSNRVVFNAASHGGSGTTAANVASVAETGVLGLSVSGSLFKRL